MLVLVHDIWASNVEDEFNKMRSLIKDYPYVAMDTEFPGEVATPFGQFKSKEDFNYQQVSCNVNMLKLIQVCFVIICSVLFILTPIFRIQVLNFKRDKSQVGFALVDDKSELAPSAGKVIKAS
ncbi:hypothetical protein PRIPAC_71677 [Pristionchus pacificus]|uniref:Uncharacterized protein n=1 Tax=Pristionchus pacificus TaxID=54126 RepID=A0A2A6BZW9_PRIPA|nr:hypothetical protein PRIPAC_71677 [Pristionchus pacificus]|eukprot:PDM71552.1 hypothetical protein PRIPAC_37959 [Pristionchus pacificus]